MIAMTVITGKTRMHSSRMRTSRSLTICRSLLPGGGLLQGGLLWGVICSQEVSALGGLFPGGGGYLLPVGVCSAGCLLQGGLVWGGWCVCLGGVSVPGGMCVSAPGGVVSQSCTEADTPRELESHTPVRNITLAQLHCGR